MIAKEIAMSLLKAYDLIAVAAMLVYISWLRSSSKEPWSWRYLMGGIFMLIVPTSLLIYSISDLMLMFSGQMDAKSIGRFTLLGGLSTTLIGLIGGGISINVISTWINSHTS